MSADTTNIQVKSKNRVADHGEVFTAEREVNAMLDLVKPETERIDSRFLEPACGNGNFLVKILERKLDVVTRIYAKSPLEWERYAVLAVSSIYGVDILRDNVEECRERLLNLFDEYHKKLRLATCHPEQSEGSANQTTDLRQTIAFILSKNILWGDALTLKTPDEQAKPIVFSEWSAVNGSMIKRMDYTMANLLESQPIDGLNLFSDLGDQAFLPKPVKEYPLVHYLKLPMSEPGFLQDYKD